MNNEAKLDIIGKGLREANDIITEAGMSYRVVSRDGVAMVGTADHRRDRVNLTLVDQKITAYTCG